MTIGASKLPIGEVPILHDATEGDAAMASAWYFSKHGTQLGPVSSSQLRQLVHTGQVLPTDLIWKEGMPTWVAAGSVEDLFRTTQGMAVQPSVLPPAAFCSAQPGLVPRTRSLVNWSVIAFAGCCSVLVLALLLGGALALLGPKKTSREVAGAQPTQQRAQTEPSSTPKRLPNNRHK
jgi:uncharacterized protein DUF4339